jgi:hypothetical protein
MHEKVMQCDFMAERCDIFNDPLRSRHCVNLRRMAVVTWTLYLQDETLAYQSSLGNRSSGLAHGPWRRPVTMK